MHQCENEMILWTIEKMHICKRTPYSVNEISKTWVHSLLNKMLFKYLCPTIGRTEMLGWDIITLQSSIFKPYTKSIKKYWRTTSHVVFNYLMFEIILASSLKLHACKRGLQIKLMVCLHKGRILEWDKKNNPPSNI